ncbi:hypothetical protein NON00_07655 [Roseomonas sp. GC11]|uniref:hypothetical protein n=1 Tax=Roseomonas sp. GC11 TaxID=2950546 RepID=UPI0021091F63|nr:hypothetical protein [Roseomonas sp. GC11]MCQ4159802.1 hypothetical protein [Roseomonas sp. GC11]
MFDWIASQIRQPSTWRGLFLLLTAGLGISVSSELQAALPNLAIAALGVWEAVRKGGSFGEPGA